MSLSRLVGTSHIYIAVALACVVLNNTLLIGLDLLGAHYILSSLVAASILIPTSYWLHLRFTYTKKPHQYSFFRYAILQCVNIPATIFLLFIFYDLLDFPMLHSAVILTATMFIYNFLGSYLTIDRFDGNQVTGIKS